MDVQDVFLSTNSSVDVQVVGIHFQSQQFERAGCTPFLNAGMSDCPASSQSGTRKNKIADAVLHRNKGTQSGTRMLQYRTDKQDAGMPSYAIE